MSQQVVNLLKIANNNLLDIQWRYERLEREVSMLEFNKQQSHKTMAYFNNQIETQRKALTSYRVSSIRERRQIEKIYNEKARIENLVTHFKNNNEEYLKIKQAAEEKVKDVLTNGKLILKFATLAVIESLRINPELCNFVLYNNSNNQSFNDIYTALILEEAEKLYNKLSTEFTNRVITASAAIRLSSLSLPSYNNNRN